MSVSQVTNVKYTVYIIIDKQTVQHYAVHDTIEKNTKARVKPSATLKITLTHVNCFGNISLIQLKLRIRS